MQIKKVNKTNEKNVLSILFKIEIVKKIFPMIYIIKLIFSI